MKIRTLLMVVFALCFFGCQTPAQTQQVLDTTKALNDQAASLQAQLAATKAQLQATTQPVTPAPTATNPSPAPIPPTAQAIAIEAKAEAAVDSASAKLAKATEALTAATAVVNAAAQGQNPGPSISAAAPLAGPYGIWVSLAGVVVSLGYGIYQNIQKSKTTTAAAQATQAVKDALASGALVKTTATLGDTVATATSATQTDHPITDNLVSVLNAAPVTPKV